MTKATLTTQQKLEAAKDAWRKAKARAGSSKSSPAYFKEVKAHQLVMSLQDQLEREQAGKA